MQADNSEIRSNSIQDKSHKPCWCLLVLVPLVVAFTLFSEDLLETPANPQTFICRPYLHPVSPPSTLEIQSYHRPPKIMYPAVRQSLPKSEHSCKVHIGIALGCIWCRMLQNAKGPGTHIVYTLALCKTSFKAKVKHSKVHGPLGQDRHVH